MAVCNAKAWPDESVFRTSFWKQIRTKQVLSQFVIWGFGHSGQSVENRQEIRANRTTAAVFRCLKLAKEKWGDGCVLTKAIRRICSFWTNKSINNGWPETLHHIICFFTGVSYLDSLWEALPCWQHVWIRTDTTDTWPRVFPVSVNSKKNNNNSQTAQCGSSPQTSHRSSVAWTPDGIQKLYFVPQPTGAGCVCVKLFIMQKS